MTPSHAEPARRRRATATLGTALVLLAVAAAIFGPAIAPHDPFRALPGGLDAYGTPQPPGTRFWLGTDPLGRDLLSRLLYGARPSLAIGVGAALLALGIGTLVGLSAGYFGGVVDGALMRLTDVFMAFPAILLGVAVAATVPRRSIGTILLVIGLVSWTLVARVVRAETLSLRTRLYVEAARAMGAGHARVLGRHVLPHLLPILLVIGALGSAATLLLDAGLSFLGLGLPVEQPSWGGMLREGQAYYLRAPWVILWPGLAVIGTVAGFNLLAFASQRTTRE
jgi:peptide/nickel transport system permease protein